MYWLPCPYCEVSSIKRFKCIGYCIPVIATICVLAVHILTTLDLVHWLNLPLCD